MSWSSDSPTSTSLPHAARVSLAVEKGHVALLCVSEPLDIASSPSLLNRARLLARSCRCLVVDLARAEFADSYGFRTLLVLAADLEADGRELRLVVQPGSRVERALNLLRLGERLQAYPTLEAAYTSGSARCG